MSKHFLSFLAFLFPSVSLTLGVLLALDPYLFVPTQVIQRATLWGNEKPGLILFNIKSRGILTVEYPVEVEVEIRTGDDIEGYFQNSEKIDLIIDDSFKYPLKISPEGFFHAGQISISTLNKTGKGTVIFPYPGTFSTFHIWINQTTTLTLKSSINIFSVEGYGVRAGIENTNRSIGIGSASVSIATIGLILKILGIRSAEESTKRCPKKPS